ncbi:MAG: hypothetical protein ACP5JH_03690 [Bacteroidota bacterium]
MGKFSLEELRTIFSSSTEFNEIFDAFQDALAQQIKDIELYRLLFWNDFLSADEISFFGNKLAEEFPEIAYDVFMWLANVFETIYSSQDNYEHAILYYQKAASVRPNDPDPYLDAADCYDPDLNIPPLDLLIGFLKEGTLHVPDPTKLYARLGYLYELAGDEDESLRYRRLAQQGGASVSE